MRRIQSLGVAVLALVYGCGGSSPEMELVEAAAAAMGGAAAIQGVQTLAIEGSGTAYRLGQNTNPDAGLPTSEVASYTREIDLANRRVRTEVTSANFLGVMGTQVTALDDNIAFNVSGNGAAARAGAQVVQDRQAEYYHHPVTVLRAALASGEGGATLTNLREDLGYDAVDVTTPEGVVVALHVDSQTSLPAMITSMTYDANLGDVMLATSFSEWTETGGLQVPQVITQRIDVYPSLDVRVTHAVNGTVGDLAAPPDVVSAPEPGPPQANVAVEALASGVWFLAGQSHHSVVVEFPTYLTLVEAPQNDTRALAVIARARELVPGKPLRYLVNTHHHFDHSGGLRAAVAEGLTVITHEINRPLFETLVERPHTIQPDHLAQNPASLTIETVTGDEVFELRDGNRVMQIARIAGSTHNDGILMVYLPGERILIEADVYTPPRGGAETVNLLRNVKERGWQVGRIAPIHGMVVPFAELTKTAMATAAQ
jgi:glyoxylase-like metal-dependent hydrolase (beta-lactamase superfamily II)